MRLNRWTTRLTRSWAQNSARDGRQEMCQMRQTSKIKRSAALVLALPSLDLGVAAGAIQTVAPLQARAHLDLLRWLCRYRRRLLRPACACRADSDGGRAAAGRGCVHV